MARPKHQRLQINLNAFQPKGLKELQTAAEERIETFSFAGTKTREDLKKDLSRVMQEYKDLSNKLAKIEDEAQEQIDVITLHSKEQLMESKQRLAEIEHQMGVDVEATPRRGRGRPPGTKGGSGRPRSAISPTGAILVLHVLKDKIAVGPQEALEGAEKAGWESKSVEGKKVIIQQELMKLVASGSAKKLGHGQYIRTPQGIEYAKAKVSQQPKQQPKKVAA